MSDAPDASDASKPLLIVVIVLLVVVALFAVGPTMGAAGLGGCDCLPSSADDRERLRARFFKAKAVTLGELSGCPKADGALRVKDACVVTISSADRDSRDLIIEGDHAARIHYL